ncbi:MAG: signal peptide peptidase SppA [Firmicutes bacterium]|nr:signal peptide peptidase SppA [Bacillota bacterium]
MDQYDNEHRRTQEERPEWQQEMPKQPYRQTVVLNQKKKMPGWVKGLLIFIGIVVCVIFLTVGCNRTVDRFTDSLSAPLDDSVVVDFGYDYIGTIYINGEISESGVGTYNHQYLLNAIDAMMDDSNNKGMILHVNTPGGSVYASDELYLKIKEYQENTGRPVYSAMQSQATSGGYYISASCDKIMANRNCWTGSIGVTMGTMMDVSGLLEKLGIKTTTITSGANKAMGSNMEPMTAEQREIFQSLVDDAYDQFVGIVADGRGMKEKEVRRLADGRIYTANQALKNGLIDEIGTYEEAIADMQDTYDLGDCSVEEFIPVVSRDLSSLFGLLAPENTLSGAAKSDARLIEELAALNGTFRLCYMADVRK